MIVTRATDVSITMWCTFLVFLQFHLISWSFMVTIHKKEILVRSIIEDLQKPVDYQFPARQNALSTLYQRQLKTEPYFCGWADYSHQSSTRTELFENPFQTNRIWKHWLYILVWMENTLKMELVRPPCPLQFPITFHGKTTDRYFLESHNRHTNQNKMVTSKAWEGWRPYKKDGVFIILFSC